MLRILSVLLLTTVAACSAAPSTKATSVIPADPYPGSGGKFFGTPGYAPSLSLNKFSTFHVGITTKAQVAAALGKPEGWVTRPDGTSQLGYAYSGPSTRVGSQSATPIVYAMFDFDANKILSHMSLPREANGE
jgi:hypothetical protein